MPNPDNPVSRSVEEKLAWAKMCYEEKGGLFLRDERSATLLSRLKGAVRASRTAMAVAGVMDECRTCEEREGGSCCGAGLENKYDVQDYLAALEITLMAAVNDGKRVGM